MPVSHPHKAIFVHIPRTAGSSLEHVLGVWGHDNRGSLTPPRLDMLFGLVGDKALQHLTAPEIRSRLGDDAYQAYFKFAFVRNPYDRVVSEYHVRQKLLPDVKISFRDFVLKRLGGGRKSFFGNLFRSRAERVLEDHLQRQSDYILDADGRLLVDFVGKYERLKEDYAKVCERLGIHAELPVKHKTEHKDFQDYYDEETLKRVGEFYRKDFEAFGYDL